MTKTNRPASTLVKLDRVRKALRFEQPDRVPISDFFWGGFVARWRRELGLPPDADPYRYYDLDWIVTTPNMDPHKGGGLIFQSDHSVASDVSGRTYDFIVKLVREYGVYPLKLGPFDESIVPIVG